MGAKSLTLKLNLWRRLQVTTVNRMVGAKRHGSRVHNIVTPTQAVYFSIRMGSLAKKKRGPQRIRLFLAEKFSSETY
jgi:hypothetical protein